ncbi:hypothetical protein Tco_1211543 [Tanacetum coccineum]
MLMILPTDPLMPDLEDTADLLNTSIFSGAYDDEDKGAEAGLNNMETTMNVSPIPTTRIHKDHPKDQIIGDINLATQIRRMTKISEEHALVSYINKQSKIDIIKIIKTAYLPVFSLKKNPRSIAIGSNGSVETRKDKKRNCSLETRLRQDWLHKVIPKRKELIMMRFLLLLLGSKQSEEVYVCQPLGFEDPQFPDKFYKVEETLCGLHQAPRARGVKRKDDGIIYQPDKEFTIDWKPFLIVIMLELALTGNPQQEVVNFLAKGVVDSKSNAFYGFNLHEHQGFTLIMESSIYLKFVDQHNMVACLERTEGNVDFHQIVDFLNASTIRYSLTISPTTYASYIEQFWATTKSKIINNETQIHAKVDAKTIVISESSVRSNLHFNDEDGLLEEQVPAIAIILPLKKTQNPRQPKTEVEDTKIFSVWWSPPEKVGDEAVHKELGDRVERAATTATSLDAEQDSGNILKTQSTRKSLDEEYVSKQGRKSDKRKPMFDDSDFAELDVDNAMKNVEGNVETQGRNTTEQITTNGDTINTASIDVSDVGPSNYCWDIFEYEMMTIADTLVAIRSTRPRTTSVVIRDVEEEPRRATPIPTVQSQDKGQRIARESDAKQEARDATFIKQIEDIQARIDADELLAEKTSKEEREQSPLRKVQIFEVRFLKTSRKGKAKGSRKKTVAKKRAGEKLDDGSVKRQKIDDDAEKEALRAYLDIILGDDEAVNVESLATKGDGSTKSYKIFTEMLDDFDRQVVLDLYRLVKERFETASPEGYDRLLWGDLITIFEPSEDDDI